MKHQPQMEFEKLLTPQEVANLFHVDPKTVTRWADAGKLGAIRTLGGHRRYRVTEIDELLNPPKLLSIEQVAKLFQVTERTVRGWSLKSIQTTDGPYYREDDLLAFRSARAEKRHK